jgi:hypothetical protein
VVAEALLNRGWGKPGPQLSQRNGEYERDVVGERFDAMASSPLLAFFASLVLCLGVAPAMSQPAGTPMVAQPMAIGAKPQSRRLPQARSRAKRRPQPCSRV